MFNKNNIPNSVVLLCPLLVYEPLANKRKPCLLHPWARPSEHPLWNATLHVYILDPLYSCSIYFWCRFELVAREFDITAEETLGCSFWLFVTLSAFEGERKFSLIWVIHLLLYLRQAVSIIYQACVRSYSKIEAVFPLICLKSLNFLHTGVPFLSEVWVDEAVKSYFWLNVSNE